MLPFQFVRRFVLEQIQNGSWKPGQRIPPEVKLAEQLSVHRPTVNRVLNDLAREDILQRRRGAGTVVCDSSRQTKKSIPGKGLVGLITGHPFDPVHNNFYGVIFDNDLELPIPPDQEGRLPFLSFRGCEKRIKVSRKQFEGMARRSRGRIHSVG